MSSTEQSTCNIRVGETFFVLRNKEVYHAATIIESRTNDDGLKEFYVHYCNSDRRLDEWVSSVRIKPLLHPELLQKNDFYNQFQDVRYTRNQKRKLDETMCRDRDSLDSTTKLLELEHQEFTRVKLIDQIQFGKYEIDTWYFSPYPDEYKQLKKLWICEYCLKYMKCSQVWLDHMLNKCTSRKPPGKEIYRHANLCVYELDGNVHKLYCQNLCLIAKLFLDHKTLYYDVTPFFFYVLCEVDNDGEHIVGYYSKEKVSADNYNLACILTLPPFQRHGYGHFLINLSYELAKIDHMIGTPEKPLSDLGRLSYRSYWERVIFSYLSDHPNCSIKDVSSSTCIAIDDIIWTLQFHPVLNFFHHGSHVHIRRDKLNNYLNYLKQRVTKKDSEAKQTKAMNPLATFDVSYLKKKPTSKAV